MRVSEPPVVMDIETAPLEMAADYVPPPDLDGIKAPKNYKKQEAIDEYVEKEKASRLVDHQDKLGKAGLDFNLARIVAIGWHTGQMFKAWPDTLAPFIHIDLCRNEDFERDALVVFWQQTSDRDYLGFKIRTFDLPMLMARSRYLGVKYPALDLSRYARQGRIIDLWDVLTFGLSDYETTTVMPRKLKTYAKRYGIPVDDDTNGCDIAALVKAGNWEAVAAHLKSDVLTTRALAIRLGVLAGEDGLRPLMSELKQELGLEA